MTLGPHGQKAWSRRWFLQQTLSGAAAWATWHGWPSQHRAMAQKSTPTGQMTWAMHVTLAPTWFDPGFDAGEYSCDAVYAGVIEGVVNDLGAVGIRAKVQARERAAMQTAQREKKVKNLTRMGSGAPGNAATRVEAFMSSGGVQSFLKDPEIDEWFAQQSRERDRAKREVLLHKIQQKVYDEAYFLPIWQLGFLCVTGPRVAVSGLGLIPGHIYSAPYEDVRLKA